MIRFTNISVRFVFATTTLLLAASSASAAQFTFLDPGYTQQIYAGPKGSVAGGVIGVPGAWNGGQLIARENLNPNIFEYSATQNTTYQGTNLHGVVATHTISGLASGANVTRGTNGFLYLPTSAGLQRVDPNNWATPAVTLTTFGGPGYGVNALPNGNIVYNANAGFATSTGIHIYNPTSNVDTLVYTAPALIDDIETSPTGLIALAGQANNTITLLTSSGSFIQSFPAAGGPDGLAFATTATPPALFSNNNDGTIRRYDFASGFNNLPTATTTIASGGSYGDIAVTGPDCAFYLIEANNGVFATRWDNGVTNFDNSIIRIAAKQGCLFDPPVGNAPEPNAAVLMLLGCAALGLRRRTESL